MYYRIKDRFALRGYEKLTGILICRPYNQIKVLKPEMLYILLLCDGTTDFSTLIPNFTGMQKDCLQKLLDSKIIEKLDTPHRISKDTEYNIYKNRFFNNFFWSVTGKCNFKCRHCYMDAPQGHYGELTHEEAIKLIDEISNCGGLKIDITGGEPFVRSDFFEVIDYIISKKISIGQIYTNGYLLTEKVIEKFKERDLYPQFVFSFDGLGWHDWMRGVKGAEQRTIDAIKLCVENNFPASVEVCLHRGNVKEVDKTVRFLSKIGISSIRLGNVSETPLWKKNSENLGLTFEEYLNEMIDYIPKFYRDGMPCDLLIGAVIDMRKGSRDFRIIPNSCTKDECSENRYLCGAIRNSCYIAPDGRIVPCMPMLSSENCEMFPKFQEVGLRNIINGESSFYMDYIDKRVKDLIKENAECGSCEYVHSCGGGCRAAAFTGTGNLMGKDEQTCFIWKNGYAEKIAQAAKSAVEKYCPKNGENNES